MKILCTGKDDFTYNRTRILLKGLMQYPGIELIQYSFKEADFNWNHLKELSEESDFVYIPPMRHSDVWPIRRRTKTAIVFDPLISKYLTRTIDHGKWWTGPEKYLRDIMAFRHCDLIMMDTQGDKDYIVDKYNLDPENIFVLPVGVDTSSFHPMPRTTDEKFVVGFMGAFIPLQGVEKIVEAARLLKDHNDIFFDIVGSGSQYKKIHRLAESYHLPNLQFRGWINYDLLNDTLNSFDVALGIFGNSLKTDLVIPNKIYQYAALQKCIISKDTTGIREIFSEGENITLTSSDPADIAEKILFLKEKTGIREELGKKAFQLVTEHYNENKIAKIFVDHLNRWKENH